MPTIPSEIAPDTDQLGPDLDAQQQQHHKLVREFRKRIEESKAYRRKLIQQWTINVDYRRGKPFASQSDDDRVAVPLDWSLTEMKQALLFSQVPAVRVNHPPETISKDVAPWLHKYEQRINDTILQAGIETAMDECLPDCINAAGIGIVMVSYESITEMVEVPAIDVQALPTELQARILQTGQLPDGSPIPMESVPKVVDYRYVIDRVSPVNFLWPRSFSSSNFDKSPWIGRSGKITWADAQQRWDLPEEDRTKFVGTEHNTQDLMSPDSERDMDNNSEGWVGFDEIFYKLQQFDPSGKNYDLIYHMVFVNGKDEPVVDEPWKGQEYDPEANKLVGAQRYPIRVLTLTYVSDEAIPPSDSAIGRPQVNEINKARTQMIKQREHSIPLRTFDVNRVDPTVQYNLMRGTWQGMIPVQGVGTNVISEVTRSAFPNENFKFDEIAKMDLFEIWMVGQDFSGGNVETKGEAQTIASNTNVRISRARAKVGKFFCSIAEVLGGLISVYEDPTSFGEGFSPDVSQTLAYSILADSTVLLDSNQRLQRLMQFMNFTAKSGRVEIESVLKEIATLSGLDPNVVIIPPAPKPPVQPNVSLRLTGTEDMLNPLTLAFLIDAGQGPKPESIEMAKQLIQMAVTPPMQPQQQPGTPPMDMPQPAPPEIGKAEADWGPMDRINRRVVERGSEQ